ncbi:nuclear transport factor 2 family protein [Reyranella sp. CPCC 100927]|uniref:nuclear transport factor 2 family protein n=1 Tax=Reyranella sp. CPCC 100927 TaxID=2599616 RepID=UPI0011B75362|nr:nuclear transport factor 2 family protein [Reyranella sp. CPCC 100927]TWT05045.1 ketosteroid isomerase [Reyranella sp. CPCC 100927]
MTREAIDVVRAHYDALGRRDRPGVLATVADDVDWQFTGPPTIPFAGAHQGRAAVAAFLATIANSVDVLAFDVERMIADGDTVVVFGREHFRVRATRRAWDVDWIQVHTVRDGVISRFREYTDTAAIAAAYDA